MSQNDLITLGQNAMYTTIILSAPVLLIGLVVGVIISLFQATTQINDQTLSFVPKIIAVFVVILIAGPWMINVITDYTNNLFEQINTFIG